MCGQVTQNNKFTISLQYFKKKERWSWFLHADAHESFLYVDTMIFDKDGQASLKFPKQHVCNVFAISQKEVRDEVDFWYADKRQSFLRPKCTTWLIIYD